MKKNVLITLMAAVLAMYAGTVLSGCATIFGTKEYIVEDIESGDKAMAENQFDTAVKYYERALDRASDSLSIILKSKARKKLAAAQAAETAARTQMADEKGWTVKSADCLKRGADAEAAQRFGEALYWYYVAAYYDTIKLGEAKKRRDALTEKIKNGNPWGFTGTSAEIQIAISKEKKPGWELEEFFNDYNPILNDFDLTVSPYLEKAGVTSFDIRYGADVEGLGIISRLESLFAPPSGGINPVTAKWVRQSTTFIAQAELINGNGKVVAVSPAPPEEFTQFAEGDYGYQYFMQTGFDRTGFASDGLIVNTFALTFVNGAYKPVDWKSPVVRLSAPPGDITDTGMKARVFRIYQYENNGGVFSLVKTTDVNFVSK